MFLALRDVKIVYMFGGGSVGGSKMKYVCNTQKNGWSFSVDNYDRIVGGCLIYFCVQIY